METHGQSVGIHRLGVWMQSETVSHSVRKLTVRMGVVLHGGIHTRTCIMQS